MFQTIEMRWFFSEKPLQADQHFDQATELQERTDWYSMPANRQCGVKVREGKLEAKLRAESLGVRSLPPLVGRLEVYRKWSLEFSANDHPSDADLEAVDWLPVDKQRNLRRYAVGKGEVQPVGARPENGCEFELTRLSVCDQIFWTVGFEAVGPRGQLEDNLRQVASHVVRQGGLLLPFTEDNSYGYAHWLTKF